MANPGKLNKPQIGGDITLLWRDVAALVDAFNAQQTVITALTLKIGARRPMDIIASGGSGMIFRGEYDPDLTYAVQDVVVVRSGANAGTFVCVLDDPTSSNPPTQPDTGNEYWVSLSNGNTIGQWL